MDKSSVYELQKIDCNCNDCIYMERDMVHYNTVVAEDYDSQYWFWRNMKARRIRSARAKMLKDYDRGLLAMVAALSLRFTYLPQRAGINYGQCTRFNKYVSFIPNTLQLDTQQCFKHRRDNIKTI